MRTKYSQPAVYRWTVKSEHNSLSAVYFGETEHLYRRLGQYLRPGRSQRTNIRVHAQFRHFLEQRSTIGLDVLSFEPFSFHAVLFDKDSLRTTYIRQCLENLALAQFVRTNSESDCRVMNLSGNTGEKLVRRAEKEADRILNELSAGQGRELISSLGKRLGPKKATA